MTQVEPKVYLIAEPKIHWEVVNLWLSDLGVRQPRTLEERSDGKDAEKLVEYAARRCYKSFEPGLNPNVTKIREDSRAYHANILRSKHGSVLEHANFTFAFEFVSRVFTHELVRHRAGCAYSQESLRYVRLTELGFWIPPEIAVNPEARRLFEQTVEVLESAQEGLALIFSEELGGDFAAKKALTSAFRRIAPEGLATGIVATFNARELRHVLTMRTDEGAEAEIRLTMDMLGTMATTRWPLLFQDFARDAEGRWVPENNKV